MYLVQVRPRIVSTLSTTLALAPRKAMLKLQVFFNVETGSHRQVYGDVPFTRIEDSAWQRKPREAGTARGPACSKGGGGRAESALQTDRQITDIE